MENFNPVCKVSQFKKESLELSNFRIQNSHTVPMYVHTLTLTSVNKIGVRIVPINIAWGIMIIYII
jgi:hypothetical protein